MTNIRYDVDLNQRAVVLAEVPCQNDITFL